MYDEKSLTGRLNTLYIESRLTNDKFAQCCGVSGSAMQNYLNGSRSFPSGKIVDVCKKFSVSAQWLFGLSDVRTTSEDMQTAIQTLGITEKATLKLAAPEYGNPWGKTLSTMIESKYFSTSCPHIRDSFHS